MSLIGYVRVSTAEQNPDLQLDAMKAASVTKVFSDIGVSGTKTKRPGLDEALAFLREGDTFVLWKLDRLGRSTRHLIEFVNTLRERGVHLRILEGEMAGMDTSTSMGRFIFTVFAGLAEVERDQIVERTQAGLKAAAARGRKGGRPRVADDATVAKARALIDEGLSVREAASRLKVGKSSLYKALGQEKQT